MANEIEIIVRGKESGLKKVDDEVKRIGDTAKGILTADFLQDAAAGAKKFIGSTIAAASDLGESVNAVQKIFGDSSKQVLAWGEKNAEAAGLSKRAFNEAIVPLGALLKNSGMSMDQVSDSTLQLTQRAADMASVFNTSVPDALEAIQAGLRGEADPLERYGVQLSAAATQAEALSMTHKKAAGELTNTELATARVNLIMKQTASTAGDFADTSDGLANSQRIAAAQIENAKAEIGQGLLPVMAKAAQVSGDVAKAFGSMPAPLQETAGVVAILGGGMVLLLPRLLAIKEALDMLRATSVGTGTALGALGRAGVVVTVLFAVYQGLEAIRRLGDEPAEALSKTERALSDFGRTGKMAGDVLGNMDWLLLLGTSSKTATEKINQLDKALADMAQNGQADAAAAAFDMLAEKMGQYGWTTDDLKKKLPEYAQVLGDTQRKTADAAAATDKAAESYDALAEGLKGAKNELDAVSSAFDTITSLDKTALSAADAQMQLAESIKKNGRELDIHTEKGNANRAAVLAMIEANIDSYEANIKAGMGAEEASRKYDEATASLEKQLRAAGFTGAQVDQLVGKYRGVPSKVSTLIATEGLTQAINDLADLLRQINGIPPRKTITVTAQIKYTEAQLIAKGTKAAGGPVGAAAAGGARPGGLTLVGENGPELLPLEPGTMVSPAANTASLLGRSGGGMVVFAPVFNINTLDPSAAGRSVYDALDEWTRSNGPLPSWMVPAA